MDVRDSEHTPSIGPKIYYSDLIYTSGEATETMKYGLIIGQGESNTNNNTMVNAGISTSDSIPANNKKWSDVDSIINENYSASNNWVAEGSITFDDPLGNGSTDVYEGEIKLVNLPASIDQNNYYLIVQAHGPAGATYTTYDVKNLNCSSLEEPSDPQFQQTSSSTTTSELEFKYETGKDPYGDPWLIDESSINLVVNNSYKEEYNYTLQTDKDLGLITIKFSDLNPFSVYEADLTFNLINPVDSKDNITFNKTTTNYCFSKFIWCWFKLSKS